MYKKQPGRELAESYQDYVEKLNAKQARFFLKFLDTGELGESYRWAYNQPTMTMKNACLLGRRILSRAGFNIEEFLEYMGHDNSKISGALDKLYNSDPDKYLSHIEKLRKLDNKRVEVSGTIALPIINIVTDPESVSE